MSFLRRRRLPALVVALALVAVTVGVIVLPGSPDEDTVGPGPAELQGPIGIAAGAGQVYVADSWNNRIVRIAADAITLVAGDEDASSDGNGGPATAAAVSRPGPVAVDAAGNLFLSELDKGGIRKVAPDGTITAVFAHAPGVDKVMAQAMAVEPGGTLLVATEREVLRVNENGTLTGVAGMGQIGFGGDGGPATSAKLDSPEGLAVDAQGVIYIADTGNNRVRKVSSDGTIATVAGNGKETSSGDGGPAVDATLDGPTAVVVDSDGAVYVAQSNKVRKIGSDGTIVSVAGESEDTSGFSGDDGPAGAALLDYVRALALDPDGNLYLSDFNNDRVRRISPDGTITTVG